MVLDIPYYFFDQSGIAFDRNRVGDGKAGDDVELLALAKMVLQLRFWGNDDADATGLIDYAGGDTIRNT